MIDLTPLEVRKKKGDFKRAMRGYDPALVDDFLELVADRLEELVRENLGHEDRIRQLEQQLRDYKECERALTDALVSAQELREEVREQALRDAELARREAEQEAEQIRTNVAQEIEREEQTLKRLRARQAQLARSYRALLERELEELEVLESGITYRAGLDEETDAEAWPEAQAVREQRPAYGAQAARDVRGVETAAADRSARARDVPARGVGTAAADRSTRAPDAPAHGAATDASRSEADEEEVDDEALERSLEALQNVFARDEAATRRDWPLPGSTQGVHAPAVSPPSEPAASATPASAAPAVEEAAALAPPAVAVDEESVAFGEASYLEEELLLEDAIEEDDVEEEPQPAAAVEPWLPKLIEDAP